jgi:large subunit ribosomal protein L22
MDALAALDQLKVTAKAACLPVEKTLRSALANAEHNFHIDKEDLKIKKIFIDKGAVLKRWRARAFGRAAPIKKHMCHITIVLDTKESAEQPKKQKLAKKK